MPSANLAAYLAKNYLTASNSRDVSQAENGPSSDFQDSSRPKKKRRKNNDDSTASGLIVADDDEDLSLARRTRVEAADDDDTPMFDTGVKSAEFRKKKGGIGWKVVAAEGGADSKAPDDNTGPSEDTEADRILAEAAEESRLRQQGIADKDAPAVVEGVASSPTAPRMQSGAKGGLQTAADTAALIAREERQKSKSKNSRHEPAVPAVEEETIYRDATGRRIDVSLKRAEARAQQVEKLRAEKKAKEDAMGDVQLREKETRKQDLEDAKFLSLGRSVDDETMNEELKEQVRWDDPMAAYMAQKRAEESVASQKGASGRDARKSSGEGLARVANRKKVYTGPAAAPNRYGILPGWRWDGVDRSNGFEKDWFQARSKKGRNEELSYQWQMDE